MAKYTPTCIDFSEIESQITGLKVGRCNHLNFNENELYQQIVENQYDLCRLKVPAEDEDASLRLHNIGLPFSFSGSIRKYRTCIADNPTITYIHPNLTFETYDGSQDKLLKDMLIDTWGDYPLGYYRSPYLNTLITKEQEIECVYQYYKKYNLNFNFPNNKIMFMKDGYNYVGVFTLNTVKDTLECNLAGILKPYRGGMYFHDEMNFKKEYCLTHGLPFFTFGARNENASVQKIFQHLGFETAGNDNVFHVSALLSLSKEKPVIKKINLSDNAFPIWDQAIFAECVSLAQLISPNYKTSSFQLNNLTLLKEMKELNILFSSPVINDKEALIVFQSKSSLFTGYLSLKR